MKFTQGNFFLTLIVFTVFFFSACAEKKPYSVSSPAQLSLEGIDENKALYVTPNGKKTNNGKSWSNSLDLQTAIDKVAKDDSLEFVLVSEGVYYADPSKKDFAKFIRLKDGVKIYGGFDSKSKKLTRYAKTSIFEGRLLEKTPIKPGVFSKTIFAGENLASGKNIIDGFVIQNTKTYGSLAGDFFISPLVLMNSKLKLANTHFNNNYSKTSGGAITIAANSQLEIENTTFNQVSSFQSAGAIENENSTLIIKNSAFIKNKGYNGGSINSTNSAKLTLEGVVFKDNFATNFGGAIRNNLTDFKAKNCKFIGNSSHELGGAISDENSLNAFIINSLFENNASVQKGGAINMTGSKNLYLVNSSFFNNSAAQFGGGLAINNATNTKVKIFNSIFWNNYHKKAAIEDELNSIYIYKQNLDIEIKNSIFNENSLLIKQNDKQLPISVFLDTQKLDFIQDTTKILNNKAPQKLTFAEGKVTGSSVDLIKNAGSNQAYLQAYDAYANINIATPKIPPQETDLEGNKRLQGNEIDIGAYEF